MADYTRVPLRFFYRGISLLPQDALPEGKAPFAQNVRSYQEGVIMPRFGLTRQTLVALPNPVHSLFRLNDTSAYADIGAPARRFAGAGTQLFAGGTTPATYAVFANLTFSGDPLTAVAATPINSPRPFLYIADRTLMRKINSSLSDRTIGIPTPKIPPTGRLLTPQVTYLESIGGASPSPWVGYASGGATTLQSRISTTIAQLLFDEGAAPSMASISLVDMLGVVPGTTIELGVSPETVIVNEVIPPVTDTTIGRILYDAGTAGLCTIQPAGSFTAGQTEIASTDDIRRRYEELNLPVPARVTVARTVDFPVNGLVRLNSAETVRILSVAIGEDGTMSFRTSTVGTFSAGHTITGLATLRAYCNTTKSVGNVATASAVQNTITPGSATVAAVGGIQTPISGGDRNWGLVGTRASQPDDLIRLGVKVSLIAYLQSVRLMLNVIDDGGGSATFLRNYYLYEWRKSDLLAAIQASAGAATGAVADALAAAVTKGQVDALYGDQYAQEPTVEWDEEGVRGDRRPGRARPRQRADGTVQVGATPPRQIAMGDNQWITLQCRVRDLTRVGTEVSRTLQHINGAAISVQFLGTTSTITCQFSDCYLTGGYGPDVGATLPPYVYRYRGRDTLTGERGNPSPSMRAGMLPHRGRVGVSATTPVQTGDTIDWFRYGGALARWQYVGSQDNTASPIAEFVDEMADAQIDGGESLRLDLYQPWPTHDLPRSGTAEVAGTAVRQLSGDTFNTGWSADSIIVINGRATTLYRAPVSTTRLEVVASVGEGAVVDWAMPAPVLLAQPLPALWGGPINNVWFHFACGSVSDPGTLYWTHGNDPDATAPANTLIATSASEPLQNGFFFDGQPYVFSTERLYRIVPTFGDIVSFRVIETACTKGLWSRWAFAVAPEGVYFLSKDGIYLTAAGGEAISVTVEDLRQLFPQDGGGPLTGI